MPSSHCILCRPLLLLHLIPPTIRVFFYESTLCMRWPKYWSFCCSIIPSKEIPGLISFRMDWLDLLAVQGTLKSLLQHYSSKASILQRSATEWQIASTFCGLNSKHLVSHRVYGSGIQRWLSWMLLAQGSSWGCNGDVRWGFNHPKAWVGLKGLLPRWFICRAGDRSLSSVVGWSWLIIAFKN